MAKENRPIYDIHKKGHWNYRPHVSMNTAIELHDSTVADIVQTEEGIVVRFLPAYLHKSQGRPGVDSGTGWVQEVHLLLVDGMVTGQHPDLPCRVHDGDLVVGPNRHINGIPVPLPDAIATELRLVFALGDTVTIKGRGGRLELLGDARYVEEFNP
jgi:hypothetical protein